MAQYLPAAAFQNFGVGIVVHRPATTIAADHDLFSIDNGVVLLTGLLGHVTVVIETNADMELDLDPDDGGSNVTLSTILAIDDDATGTLYTLNTTFGGVMIATLDYAINASLEVPIALVPGDIVFDEAGTSTGEIEWWATYIPLDKAATLTAV